MTNPHPVGSAAWQAWLNEQIAEHDAKVANEQNDNQDFEISDDK